MDIKIMENGIVSFEETRVLKQVTLSNFIENLANSKPLSSDILPKNCKIYSKEMSSVKVVIEQTPSIRVLNWGKKDEKGIPFPISLPFIYWFLNVNEGFISRVMYRATLEPVKSKDDITFSCGLPNFYDSGFGELCKGSMDSKTTVDNFVNNLWEASWNGDLSVSLPEGIASYEDWALKTVENPLMWKDLKLIHSLKSKTIGDVLEDL
jgi:hypothetical protein